MNISRRTALKLGLIGAGSCLSPLEFPLSAVAATQDRCLPHPRDASRPTLQPIQLSPQFRPFQLPFKPLATLSPQSRDATYDYYEIQMRPDELEILPGLKTKVWRYVGNPDPTHDKTATLIGPVIRQPKLRQSIVRMINKLGTDDSGKPIQTSIHLHGMASLPQYDGYAEDLIPPDFYKDYYYPNNRAATLWYHDHAVGRTSRQVYMGLAGMYIVDQAPDDFVDPTDADLLPSGAYDVPLVIQDKQLAPDGSLVFNDRSQRGLYADIVLVNGVPWPKMEVANRKYRFRVLNAGTSRTLQLGLSTGDNLIVIASDAGLLSQPVPTNTLRIGVAERYEFIIDFSKYPVGQRVLLLNPPLQANLDQNLSTSQIMCFEVTRQELDPSSIPSPLGKVRTIAEILGGLSLAQLPTHTFRLGRSNGQWKINNHTWDPGYIEAHPELNQLQVWRLVNAGGGWVHPVHIHLVDLRLLSRNGTPPLAYEQGWKDTFYLGEFQTLQVLTRFGPHQGKYMMHCHNLVHEDHDMMTQFQVGTGGCEPCSAPARALPAASGFTPATCKDTETGVYFP